jgi:FG-GAP repeat
MAVADADKIITTLPIGVHVDATAFDPATKLIFNANRGSVTIIRQDSPDTYSVVQTLEAAPRANTLALDTKTHKIYLSAADFETVPSTGCVYQRNESSWTQQARLTPGSFGLPGDAFGTSVAIDGNTIVVGAPGDGTFGFAYIFVNIDGVWTQQRDVVRASDNFVFGNFGAAVSISKDTIAVGAPFTRRGAVYMYARNPATGFWDPQGKLVPNDQNGLSFGGSTSLVGNTVVIGANRTNGFTGTAYIFGRLNNVWSQTAILAPTPLASNFGFSTAMSGSTVVVGAPDGSTTGAAFVFTQSNGVWTQQARLQGNGLAGTRALLGYSVSLNGNTLAAGAPDDSSGNFAGSAYVYTGVEATGSSRAS